MFGVFGVELYIGVLGCCDIFFIMELLSVRLFSDFFWVFLVVMLEYGREMLFKLCLFLLFIILNVIVEFKFGIIECEKSLYILVSYKIK